jgi:hypothetical protein
MDSKLTAYGYDLEPSKYTPSLGYSRLRIAISGRPTQRFFDVKKMRIPTFDGRFYHQTSITRHELAPKETFQVCVGELVLDSYQGESLRAFSFGGKMSATVEREDLICELNSSAPIFQLQDDPGSVGNVIIEEILDLLAEIQAGLAGHEDELYTRLASFEPYQVFLSSLVSLEKRVDNVPTHLRNEKYHKVATRIKHAIQIVCNTDGWDGDSPRLEELISSKGE